MADETEAELFADARTPPAREVTQLTPRVRRLIAPNASPFTFNGTCTYILGQGAVAVLDPGPADDAHFAAILAATQGETIETILITHTHRDHSPLAARLCGIDRRAHRRRRRPTRPSAGAPTARTLHTILITRRTRFSTDGERFEGPGFALEILATPGHCANHLCFALAEEAALFSGDHVMGWSTSVVIPPDGSMGAYMASLDKLKGRSERIYWPGHGGPVVEPQRYLRALITHRRQREASILSALADGARTIPAIVARVYSGLDPRARARRRPFDPGASR